MTNKTQKECDGCSISRYCPLEPYFIDDNNKILCPCTVCLVKGICDILCDDFRIYKSRYWKFRKEEANKEEANVELHVLIINKKILICPCQSCIIKVVCVEACKDFKQYNRLMVNRDE